ncbi:hypothetical protein [Halorussus halobius]|uniref:hypothetical protein n=1 Tax=Halorussus halobius TaxID=1710537 RepID=UPI001FCF25A8|nr:hypothetical protein [Halorussus halobius]
MTYRSESRGILYTAPPEGNGEDVRPEESTDTNRDGRVDEPSDDAIETGEAAADDATETPSLEPTTATTDANWTGSVPADD